MRAPSEKALQETFQLSAQQAKLVRKLAKAVDDADQLDELVTRYLPNTERWVRSLYSSPYDSHMWRVSVALEGINEVLGGYGVEPLGEIDPHGGPPYEYINMGDTYATTLVYGRSRDNLIISSWGDVVERHPRLFPD